MMTSSGKAVLRMPQMNDHINKIMKAWCVLLDSPDSRYVLNEIRRGLALRRLFEPLGFEPLRGSASF